MIQHRHRPRPQPDVSRLHATNATLEARVNLLRLGLSEIQNAAVDLADAQDMAETTLIADQT